MGVSDVKLAISAAHSAQASWGASTASHRAKVLRKLHGLMLDKADDLAELMAQEAGKPFAEARGEVAYSAGYVQWFAEEARRAYGSVIPPHSPDRRLFTTLSPVGVAALITPWNFPLAMLARKVAPALAAGCASVTKPAEDTPLTALAFAGLAEEAGVPPGVVNVVPTPRSSAADVGTQLCTAPEVAKVSFTGSTAVGKLLLAQCASTVKRTSMELGGNAPFIVFEDADVDAAVAGTLACKFRFGGQTCVSANRVLVHAAVHDEYVEKLTAAVKSLKVGDPLLSDTQVGPLINEAAVSKVQGLVQDAASRGAAVQTGGSVPEDLPKHLQGGHYFSPTVLTGVTSAMRCAEEEIFGPLAAIAAFETEAEAVEAANSTRTGLAGYFFTQSLNRAWRVADALQVGMCAVNEGVLSTETAPFGGIKESGMGREGGAQGLLEYCDTKYVVMGGLTP